MNAKTWPLLVVIALFVTSALGQGSVGVLDKSGENSKFLTAGQLDRWVFDGEKGETIIAHVTTDDFDPILELAQVNSKDDDKVLLEVDDLGSESRFSFRLPEKGKYKIRVHAFKYQGGGNYSLSVQRFQAKPLVLGKPQIGGFDREGKGYFYFPTVKDQILTVELKGTSYGAWGMLDNKGRELQKWTGVLIEENGECNLVTSGQPDSRYELVVRPARQRALTENKAAADKLAQGELDVWSFQGQPGDFRLLEVEKKGELQSRLIYAPLDKKDEQRLGRGRERPEIEFLPVASRGGRQRFAAILGRQGRYQLQLYAATPTEYKLTARDPSVPIEAGKEIEGDLAVGGAGFYSFKAAPGQLFQASLKSKKFVPTLQLYDQNGSRVGGSGNDDSAAGEMEGRLTHMVLTEGLYRMQVTSLGDGGGGDFRLALEETKLKELQVGGRGEGTVQPGVMDFWAFAGQEGKTVFLSVRSLDFLPSVSLRSPDGVQLIVDNHGSAETGSLFALKLPKTGRYTAWVSSRRGAGEYTARLIDGD